MHYILILIKIIVVPRATRRSSPLISSHKRQLGAVLFLGYCTCRHRGEDQTAELKSRSDTLASIVVLPTLIAKMSSIQQPQKPIETIHPSNLPNVKDPALVAEALNHLVDQSTEHNHNVHHTIHAPMHNLRELPDSVKEKLKEYVPGLEKLASDYHVGNFVSMRTGERFFESMPIYPRCVTFFSWKPR